MRWRSWRRPRGSPGCPLPPNFIDLEFANATISSVARECRWLFSAGGAPPLSRSPAWPLSSRTPWLPTRPRGTGRRDERRSRASSAINRSIIAGLPPARGSEGAQPRRSAPPAAMGVDGHTKGGPAGGGPLQRGWLNLSLLPTAAELRVRARSLLPVLEWRKVRRRGGGAHAASCAIPTQWRCSGGGGAGVWQAGASWRLVGEGPAQRH